MTSIRFRPPMSHITSLIEARDSNIVCSIHGYHRIASLHRSELPVVATFRFTLALFA